MTKPTACCAAAVPVAAVVDMGRRGGGRVRGAGEDPDLRRCRRRRVHGCPTFFVEEAVVVHLDPGNLEGDLNRCRGDDG
ncbi:hypothetical protein ACFX13_012462 [Malus domestica]